MCVCVCVWGGGGGGGGGVKEAMIMQLRVGHFKVYASPIQQQRFARHCECYNSLVISQCSK